MQVQDTNSMIKVNGSQSLKGTCKSLTPERGGNSAVWLGTADQEDSREQGWRHQ